MEGKGGVWRVKVACGGKGGVWRVKVGCGGKGGVEVKVVWR